MDSFAKDVMAPFLVVFLFLGVIFPIMIYYSQQQGEKQCKQWLSEHGYSFVAYHSPSFGSPEQCWGLKDGASTRVY